MRKSRHLLDERNQRFIQTVIETSPKRLERIQKDSILWRAQLDIAWEPMSMPTSLTLGADPDLAETVVVDIATPLPAERMVPRADRATEGRVNAKGIPCLYCSTDRDTAMTEVRPWIGSWVTVSQFVVLRNLKVVDCSADSGPRFWYTVQEPAPEKREERVWQDINRAFSEPATRLDDVAEYAPTQILAEAFRSAGYDGVLYGSKLGDGKTIALFDLKAAALVTRQGYRVTSVKLEFSNPTSVHYAEEYMDSEDGDLRDPISPDFISPPD